MTRMLWILSGFSLGCSSTVKPLPNDPLLQKPKVNNCDPRLVQPMPEWKPPQPPGPPIETLPAPIKN